ncbi:hypothetical protein EKN06_01315 [Croceicoccus ponticola]|uniref:Uncharacterized protein n=1 Tax=Croceicoccus ponticola TaxID=2217664 RepID=A0A437GZU6_9SPHN|nr:hypothetical protein [Croceicoccus ponticola]RVQ68896.1 hypothetical protein EKN06_01315 [Croceicoccus ponticola]
MTRMTLAGAMLVGALALTGCDDAQPGLEDEVRAEKVVSCKDAIGRFAPTDRKKDQLCECTTAKLAAEELTVADLSGAKRDRAMEQLRWCLQQVGLMAPAKRAAPELPADESEPEADLDAVPKAVQTDTEAEVVAE